MRKPHTSEFLVILSTAFFATTASASAGQGAGGHAGAPSFTPPSITAGSSTGMTRAYSTDIDSADKSSTGAKGIHNYDMTQLGADSRATRKGSFSGQIKPIDPGLDMTKLGTLSAGTSPGKGKHYDGSQSTAETLDEDIKDFDARMGLKPPVGVEGAAGPQPPDRIGRRGTRNAASTDRRSELDTNRQTAAQQQQLEQSLATTGAGGPTEPTFGLQDSTPSTSTTPPSPTAPPIAPPQPDSSLSTAPSSNAATNQTTESQATNASAPLSSSDLATLRSLFFPSGTPSSAAMAARSSTSLDVNIGSTLSADIALYPLPDASLTSTEASNLGYFYNGQSIVIADFSTRAIVGVVSNGS